MATRKKLPPPPAVPTEDTLEDTLEHTLPEEPNSFAGELVPVDPGADPALDTLERVVHAIQHGGDMRGLQQEITRLIMGQEDRAELIDNLLLTQDYGRMVTFMRARAKLETELLRALDSETLGPIEKMAFLRYLDEQTKAIGTRVKGGATGIKDVLQMLTKVDFVYSQNQVRLERRLGNTTPQGREIIRRHMHKVRKMAAAADGAGKKRD